MRKSFYPLQETAILFHMRCWPKLRRSFNCKHNNCANNKLIATEEVTIWIANSFLVQKTRGAHVIINRGNAVKQCLTVSGKPNFQVACRTETGPGKWRKTKGKGSHCHFASCSSALFSLPYLILVGCSSAIWSGMTFIYYLLAVALPFDRGWLLFICLEG